ncbi:MAG: hypothetical protein ACM3NW_03985, partial [Syntrophomonadaceae bacterium]
SLFVLAALRLVGPAPALADDARTITVFEGRQFAVPVPAGWSFDERSDPHHGLQTIQLEDPGKEVVLQITFFPDSSGKLSSREALEAEAKRILEPYLETSVEKEVRLTFFDSPDGIGAYSAFTDGKLDPKHIPEDEKLISVSGIRAWKGGYDLFTILTNTTDSAAYKKALDIAVSGLRQVKAPVAF